MLDILTAEQVERDNKIIEFMSNATNTKYSDEQKAILRHHGGMVILACAGSGKTSILTHLIAKRIQSGEISDPSKLLCTTYSKPGADEMNQRLDALCRKLGIQNKASIRTLHSTYYQILRDLQYNMEIVSESDKMRYIREACKEVNLTLKDEDFQTLESLLSYQINNLMSDEAIYTSYVFTLREQITRENYSKIRNSFYAKKQQHNCMDFDDMQLIVYQLLRSQAYGKQLQNYCHSLWKYIYIDEAQDISRIQFEILKYLVSDPENLVFIGDDDQCIYEWRGAAPIIIQTIGGVYTNLTSFTLTTNYRCYGDIVRKAAFGIQHNKVRSNKTMIPFKEGGDIKLCDTGVGNIYDMSKYVYKYIKQLVIDENVSPADIAVLSRNNQHLTVLANMLFKDGIYCKSTEDMKFTRCMTYNMVSGIVALGQNTTNGNITGNNLSKCVDYLKANISKEIGKIQSSYGASLKDVLGFVLTEYMHESVEWDNPGYKVSKFDSGKYGWMFQGLQYDTKQSLITIYNMLCDEETKHKEDRYTESVAALLTMFLNGKAGFFYKSEESMRFMSGYCEYLIELIRELGIAGYNRYIKQVEQFEAGKMAVVSPMVTLTTMHSAKGKEWKYVMMFADDNVSFPSFQSICTNIEQGVKSEDIRHMLDENRRLHYVAMTRAKEHLVIFGNKKNLSVYTLEALGEFEYPDNNNYIVSIAQHGLPIEMQQNIDKKLFSPNSEYHMDIDIKELKTPTELKYYSNKRKDAEESNNKAKNNSNSGFNINSMQTFAPQATGTD